MDSGDASGSAVIEALYTLAANPGSWREIIDALESTPPRRPNKSFLSLAGGAERVAAATRDPAAAERPTARDAITVLIVSRAGRLLAASSSGQSHLEKMGFAGAASGLRMTSEANLEVLAAARRRVATSPRMPVIVKFLLAEGRAERFAYVIRATALPKALAATLPLWVTEPDDDLAIVMPPQSDDPLFLQVLTANFGLTAAETRLAAHLADGMSLKQAASELGLSLNTVRNQLTAIFEKLNTHRQGDLVRALGQLSILFDSINGPADSSRTRRESQARGGERLFEAPAPRDVRLPDGRRFAYRDYGVSSGQAILFCHGGLGASLLPPGTDDLCRDLGLRIICPERAGVGRSDPSPNGTIQGAGEDMGILLDRLGIETTQICTLTSGARFGVAAAAALGERATRLLMLSPRAPPEGHERHGRASPMVRLQAGIARNAWIAESLFAVMRLRLSWAVFERITRASAVSPGDAAYLKAHPEVIDLMYEALRESWLNGSAGTARESVLLAQPTDAKIDALRADVEIWHGSEDAYADGARVAGYYVTAPERIRVLYNIGNYMMHKHWIAILGYLSGKLESETGNIIQYSGIR